MDYKELQEEFVRDHNGTSMSEVFMTLSILPLSLWLYGEVYTAYCIKNSASSLPSWIHFSAEFLLLVVPLCLSFTFSDVTPYLLSSTGLASVVLTLVNRKTASVAFRKVAEQHQERMFQQSSFQPYVTCFRAQMMLATCFSILAVDFTIFPRRFAKTETYGTSLMDIGVGAFVFSSGLTSKYAKPSTPSVAATTLDYVHLLPIFILGLFRLLTVKGIEYQEHASEYGVHWNFYFTMGAVQVAYIALKSMGKALTSISSALVLIALYQIALSFSGLSEYIITAPRINLYSQNREGIWSCLGYLSLYLLAIKTGFHLVFTPSMATKDRCQSFSKYSTLLWLITGAAQHFIALPSRRMVNFTYVAWILAHCYVLLCLTLWIQTTISIYPQVPRIFNGVSRYQLHVFVVANLLTGGVNLSMQTLYATPFVSSAILLGYMVILCMAAFSLGAPSTRPLAKKTT